MYLIVKMVCNLVYDMHGENIPRNKIQQSLFEESVAADHNDYGMLRKHANENIEDKIEKENIEPQKFAEILIERQGHEASCKDFLPTQNFFEKIKKESIAGYNSALIAAVGSNDVSSLRELHQSGGIMHASNKFGESVLHMACRRGHTETVRFLISEAKVSLRIRDDFGRTILHDAFWCSQPNSFIVEMILDEEPDLLMFKDKRGNAPLEYVKREHWYIWNNFLVERQQKLLPRI